MENSRPIEFRAWDNLQGGKFEYWDAKTDKLDGIFWLMIKDKSFEDAEQYTGLKDKNRVKCFTRDLVAVRISNIIHTREVFQDISGGFCIKLPDYCSTYQTSILLFSIEFEITGNIHEDNKAGEISSPPISQKQGG